MAEISTRRAADAAVGGQTPPSDLFPLALTPFEQYMLLDDSPERPMTAFIELDFSTSLEVSLLEQALAIAVQRNPLLASRIIWKDRCWQWHHDPHFVPKVLTRLDVPPAPLGRPRHIDLTREPGIRVWYLPSDNGSKLTCQIHHACSDGIGLRRLFVNFLRAYAQLSTDEHSAVQLDKLDVDLLKDRGLHGREDGSGCRSSLTAWQRLRNTQYFFFSPPRELVVPKETSVRGQSIASEESPTCNHFIDPECTALIQDKARQRQLNLNDLSLALLFDTCWRWNQQHAGSHAKSRLRILMPFDLRSRTDLRMPATNRMSFAFLGRTHRQCRDWEQLLQSVQAETQAIKETRLSLDFLNGLSAAARSPRLLRWLIGRNRRMATIALTYGGDVFRGWDRYFPEENQQRLVGDARLRSVVAAPPVRVGTNLSLGMCVSWGQLCFSAAWSRDDFTDEACDLFLKQYVTAWKNWATHDHPGDSTQFG